MSDTPDILLVVSLEENLIVHETGTEIFTSFVIERLRTESGVTFAELSVTLIEASGQERTEQVRLEWKPESKATKPFALQEKVMTEWGALGIACALIPAVLGMRVLSVAQEGERFDYRIGTETAEHGLEVSGTVLESIEELRERHRQKVRQLRENPEGLSGYVIVVGFTRREVLISFHPAQEGKAS